MTTKNDILEELAKLGAIGDSYKPRKLDLSGLEGLGNAGKRDYTSILQDIDWDKAFTPAKDDGKKKKGSGIDFWGLLSGTLGQVGGAVTDQVYNTVSSAKQIGNKKNDMSLLQELLGVKKAMTPSNTIFRGIGNGAKEQWKDWRDGNLSWGDVPAVGFLHGMDEGWKRGTDIAKDHIGIKNKAGQIAAGVGIDIALDPLTYLTGGLSTATKAKKVAELAEMAKIAKGMGISQKVKTADELGEVVRQTLTAKYPNLAKAGESAYNPAAKSMIDKQVEKIVNRIKTSGAKAFNDHINTWSMSLPKVNKTLNIGKVTKGALHRSEATVPSHLVSDLIKAAVGKTSQAGKLEKEILGKYGISSLEDLSKTQFDDLMKRLSPLVEKSGRTLPDSIVKWTADYGDTAHVGDDVAEVLHQIENPKNFRKALDDTTANVTVPKLPKDANVKWDKEVDLLQKSETRVGKDINKAMESGYDQLNNAKTGFEHFLDKHNPFNARTLRTGDKFVDSMADHIADADSMRVGENAKYQKALMDLEKGVKKAQLNQRGMEDIIHIIEGTFEGTPTKTQQKLANMISNILKQVANDDQAAGVLDKLRKNYFPHVVNKSEEEMKKIQEFIAKREDPAQLNGKSSKSGYNKSRTSFETIKDRDNYMAKLAKEIAGESDEARKAELEEQLSRVESLFDTDIVSALTRRIKEGVRARAMKEMQGELSKFGMMKTNPKEPPTGLHKLDPDEAKKLGLGKGQHYIHPKVLEGMKRTDDIFTNQGMNKFMRHWSAINDIWRSLVTHYKPSHYRNNLIGNGIINMAAGVGISDYKQAGKLIKNLQTGKLSAADITLLDSAYKHNIISGGFLTDAMKNYNFEVPTALEKFADKVIHNKGISKMRSVGEKADDVTRLANYINGLKKFGSDKKAAQQVREYLFNYNELTDADRSMRMIVPFWNWMKRNIPLQMKLLMEQPKFAMNIERGKQVFNEGREGEDWQKDSGIKVPFTNHYTSIPSPTQDLKSLTEPRALLSSISAGAKVPLETIMNKKIFTGGNISYGSNDVQLKDYPEYLAKNLGIVGNLYDVGSGKKDILEALINLFNPVTKIQE